MKKLLFIFTLTLFAFNSQAQGTLQFNQVITITLDTSFAAYGSYAVTDPIVDIYTVPANRVVKITKAINEKAILDYGCQENVLYFTINGIRTANLLLEGAWIKEGDIIGFSSLLRSGASGSNYCNQYDNIFISLIEYNIIPE